MKNKTFILAIVLLFQSLLFAPATGAQGLQGGQPQGLRGGGVLGAPLLPGKNDAERWRLVRGYEKRFVGMTKDNLERLFGKPTYGENKRELLYQITEWKKNPKVGDVLFQELCLHLDESETVHSFSIQPVHFN